MKYVIAVIQPDRLDEVLERLTEKEIHLVTVHDTSFFAAMFDMRGVIGLPGFIIIGACLGAVSLAAFHAGVSFILLFACFYQAETFLRTGLSVFLSVAA